MKTLKLNFLSSKASEILTREQLKEITGGGGYDGSITYCASSFECPDGMLCCRTTDGSAVDVCVHAAPGGGCPDAGVSGCSTNCTTGGVQVGCYYDINTSRCRCINDGSACA